MGLVMYNCPTALLCCARVQLFHCNCTCRPYYKAIKTPEGAKWTDYKVGTWPELKANDRKASAMAILCNNDEYLPSECERSL